MPTAATGTPSSNKRANGQAFPQGSTVEVHGLLNAAELNGKIGTVSGFDHYKERFIVYVDGDYKALKGTNLKTAPRSAQGTTSQPCRTSASRAQSQRPTCRAAQVGASVSWKDQLQAAAMAAKGMCDEGTKRIQRWYRTRASKWWSSSPFPKMIVTLIIAGLLLYWMSSDPRYSGAPRSKQQYTDSGTHHNSKRYEDQYDRHDASQRSTMGRRADEYDDYSRRDSYNDYDYGRREAGGRRADEYDNYRRRDDYNDDHYWRDEAGYDDYYSQQTYGRQPYNAHYHGSSGGSSMMWMMLLGIAFFAYRGGFFERLRGMNFFQLYFLFNLLSSMFGGMRMMGRPGMGMGGIMGGMGRGFGRRGYR